MDDGLLVASESWSGTSEHHAPGDSLSAAALLSPLLAPAHHLLQSAAPTRVASQVAFQVAFQAASSHPRDHAPLSAIPSSQTIRSARNRPLYSLCHTSNLGWKGAERWDAAAGAGAQRPNALIPLLRIPCVPNVACPPSRLYTCRGNLDCD